MTLNQDALLAAAGETDDSLGARGLTRDALGAIHADRVARVPVLEGHAATVATTLGRVDAVHSPHTRVKDPEHLVRKVLRKAAPGGDPVSAETFRSRITDLVGVCALRLYKAE